MWYLRIWPGVRQHFRPRWIEWVMGVWLIVWGGNLLLKPGDDFETTASNAWDGLAYWFGTDVTFGTLMVSVGILRLAALTINGTFHDTIYARYSPLVRASAAFLGCGVWLMIWMSATAASTQGAVAYWAPCLIEGFTAYYVFGEFGNTLGTYRNGRTRD